MTTDNTYTYTVTAADSGQRLDKYLSALIPDISRARLQKLIADGCLTLNEETVILPSHTVRVGDQIDLDIPEVEDATPQAENIPLAILYEDDDLLVINKPAGLVVHPGAGNWTGTLVNALLHHCKDSLSGIGGVVRPGIVHRLDKDTSGLMIVAKHDKAHNHLSEQLASRTLGRTYHAIVLGTPIPIKGEIDQPIGRHPTNRLKMTIGGKNTKEARTFYKRLNTYGDMFSLVECQLESGRTHQIRVHMNHLGYPLIGDPLYGPQATKIKAAAKKLQNEEAEQAIVDFPRQALHAKEIHFIHPISGEQMSFESEYPEDIQALLSALSHTS